MLHGHEVADPYRWLEDATSADTLQWVAAQNLRTRRALESLSNRAPLHARFVELLAAPISTACSVAGASVFTLERSGGEAQFRLIVRSAVDPTAEPRTLVDPATLFEDSTAALDWYYPSPDGARVAFGVSIGGDERSTLHIIDIASGELLADTIPDTRWSTVRWTEDGGAFAYTRFPPARSTASGSGGTRSATIPATTPSSSATSPSRSRWWGSRCRGTRDGSSCTA